MNANIEVTDKNATEDAVHRWSAEASTIGLKPGDWPAVLPTSLGNQHPFLLGTKEKDGAELVCVNYRQAFGNITLKIFND